MATLTDMMADMNRDYLKTHPWLSFRLDLALPLRSIRASKRDGSLLTRPLCQAYGTE
jgi:hypothetical protein